MLRHLPNALTLLRAALVPVFLLAFLFPPPQAHIMALGIFLLAGLTDYWDGKLARALNVVSPFGTFLDPIADKMMVAAALMMLVHMQAVSDPTIVPAVLILLREIIISGLREYLAGAKVSVPVSGLAKWKTAVQMLAISVLLAAPLAVGDWTLLVRHMGEGMVWAAAILTLVTGGQYLIAAWPHITWQGGSE